MPLFVVTCLDKPDNLARRMATRPAHQAYLAARKDMVRLGGPFLNAEGGMIGSMLIVEAPDLAAAQEFADNDPYKVEGVFESSEVRGFNLLLGSIS